MNTVRSELAQQALEKSLEVRESHGYDFRSPICVYELCDRAGVKVRFEGEISMEGVYVVLERPTILLSSLRPLPRRAFTCAHELGHHAFGHGSTIDELRNDNANHKFEPNEFLADAFAGFVLMPAQAVKRAFASRGWDSTLATAEQVYRIACAFGVGYETLISHMQYSLRNMSSERGDTLRKVKLPQIRELLLGEPSKEALVVADRHHALGTLDAEVGALVLLPFGAVTHSDQIEFVRTVGAGSLFRATRPGLARVTVPTEDWAVIVRVSRFQYSGLVQYRHLEETDAD